jgi:hypothetical protein
LSSNILKPFFQFCQCCWSWCLQRSEKNIFAMHRWISAIKTTDLISLHDKPVSIIVWHVALQHIWSDLTCSWIYYMIKPNTPGSWSIYGLHNRKQVQFWASQDHCFLCCAQCLKSPMSKIKTVKVLPSLWRNRGTL